MRRAAAAARLPALRYRVGVGDPKDHEFHVSLRVAQPGAALTVSLPVWVPGSYMVRELARHLNGLQARQGSQACAVTVLDKASWRIECHGTGPVHISYRVHAFDASVRAAFLSAERGFFNGTSVFLRVHGREDGRHEVCLDELPAGWEVATAMPAARAAHTWHAADYDELVDHPFELGTFWRGRFEVRGVPHELVVTGAWPTLDTERLLADAQRACAAAVRLWHGEGAPPWPRYVFLLHLVDGGYGGLEHRASTAVIASRSDAPRRGAAEASDAYVSLLGLLCHEYLHAWNVKRLHPAELARLDYTRENHSTLLWFFEGFTTYYDELLLLRAGLIDAPTWLRRMAGNVRDVRAVPGRHVQSLARASFDAWIRYYRPDENSPNSTVSYYTKGLLLAACLDMRLRLAGRGTLDDLMRTLWGQEGGALTEADILHAVQAQAGADVAAELHTWVHVTDDLPLADLLGAMGVDWAAQNGTLAAGWGLRLSEGPVTGVVVKSVLRGGAARAAGLCAGDEILALAGWRVRRLEEARAWLPAAGEVAVLVSRDQRILSFTFPPPQPDPTTIALTLGVQPAPEVAARRHAWLGA